VVPSAGKGSRSGTPAEGVATAGIEVGWRTLGLSFSFLSLFVCLNLTFP
jgi:hypothetical protein